MHDHPSIHAVANSIMHTLPVCRLYALDGRLLLARGMQLISLHAAINYTPTMDTLISRDVSQLAAACCAFAWEHESDALGARKIRV
jgi:hypothetical protein